MNTVKINDIEIGLEKNLTLIAGPCQIESLDHAEYIAGTLKDICKKLNLQLVYKSSFDKANRSSIATKRGLGIDRGLKILNEIKTKFNLSVLTDIHESYQAKIAADAGIDILQIPAFLCRQTDLLLSAGNTGKAVNVKKGQFLAPHDMKNVAEKISSTGNNNILLTERGYVHGYNNLVVDMRGFYTMAKTGYPVVFDATHSVQQPGSQGISSGGDRTMVPLLARAAVATGSVSALFMECHENPDLAPSDGSNMIKLDDMYNVLKKIVEIHAVIRQ